ncbi:MAG: hypothetical protein ACREBS_00430 [Nitrososphaerales archaeon]
MPSKEWTNMRVRKSTTAKLEQVYERRKHDLLDRGITSVTGMVQDLLVGFIERDEVLSKYVPHLSAGDVELDHFAVKDSKLARTIDVYLSEQALYCDYDKSFDCVHIGFVWSLPELYRTLKQRGMKPPKS